MDLINQEKSKYTINSDSENYNNKRNLEATITGVVLFIIDILFVTEIIQEGILYTVLIIITNLVRIPIALWCSTIAKRKNRDSKFWAGLGFFFPAITLIILGNNKKLNKINIEVAKYDKQKLTISNINNPNNLPYITLPTSTTVMLIDALSNDNLTLKYMINNYKRYVKENGALFPLYAAVELNRRGEKFEKEILTSLNNYSKDKGFQSFYENLEYFKTNE